MAGKRKKTHWAVRRKSKQARRGDGQKEEDKPQVDRRAGLSEEPHPGSYAARRKPPADGEPAHAALPFTKRRYGLWVAFCGKNYSGMQMNEGVETIEAELERALFEAGGIAESNYGFLQKIGWSRAARTDKGVHAAGQLLTAKLHVGEDVAGFMAKVNAALPADIRVMQMVTVTKNFNAKMTCDQRTYEYLAPTFIFAKRSPAPSVEVPATNEEKAEKTTADEPETQWPADLRESEEAANEAMEVDAATLETHRAFRLSGESLATLNAALRVFEGTHNFHNFTSKMEPWNPQAMRFIMSFVAEEPFVAHGLEWVRLRVVGQSFLLHHIRKMIGTAVEVVAGVTPLATLERAMQQDKMDLPKAPSVGLYLAQAHFEVYNGKMREAIQTSHPALDLADAAVAKRVEQFKRDVIFAHIMAHEERTRTYAKWLRTLQLLPFDYVAKPHAQWKQEKEDEARRTDRAGKRDAAKAARLAGPQADDSTQPDEDAHVASPATAAVATEPATAP